ncbi:MAG: glycosyltransferase family 9 protein [Candidatus Kapaibacterium sp.]
MKEARIKKAFKQIEIALRRGFIGFLQFRSRFGKRELHIPLPPDVGTKPTILFLRQDRLGDAIISTPVFIELRNKYPYAQFIMLLGENNKEIADLLTVQCEIIIYKKKPFTDIAMLRRLRKRKIDVLIDLMDNPSSTSSILTAAISARYSLGIQKENASSYNVVVPLIDRARFHISRRIAELLRPFGIDPDSVDLRARLKDLPTKRTEGRLGLVISAGVPGRQLSPAVNAQVAAKALSVEEINEVMIFYHPKDKNMAESIQLTASDPRVMLAPMTSTFADYAAVLNSCEFVITPDTSAVHLCSAYLIPVVVMTNPFPPTLHYWTPIGVPYEMITEEIRSLEAATIIARLELLIQKVRTEVRQEAEAQ